MNLKKFEECFDVYSFFYPNVFFEGDISFSKDPLSESDLFRLNALETRKTESTKKGKKIVTSNMYDAFLDKHYYYPLSIMFGSTPLAKNFKPGLVLTANYCENGKNLHFAHLDFLVLLLIKNNPSLLAEMMKKIDDNMANIKSYSEEIKTCLRIQKEKYEEVLKNRETSPNFGEIFIEYKITYADSVSFETFIKAHLAALNRIIPAIAELPDFFATPVNVKEFVECFNYDKICLCIAYTLLEVSQLSSNKLSGKLDNSIALLEHYLCAVEDYRNENPRYNPKIIDKKNNEKVVLTYDDLVKDYEKLIAKHPNYKRLYIEEEQIQRVIRMLTGKDEYVDTSIGENQHLVLEAIAFIHKSQDLAYRNFFLCWVCQ